MLKAASVFGGAGIGSVFGAMTAYGTLEVKVTRLGIYIPGLGLKFDYVEDYGLVCARVVTDAGVAFMVNDWFDNSKDISNFNAHAMGTGGTAEAVGDTALVTEVETRTAGTKSKPAANQIRSVGTVTATTTRAILEHGLFDSTTVSGSTLWDRSIFSVINLLTSDSIQFTYTCTITSGG